MYNKSQLHDDMENLEIYNVESLKSYMRLPNTENLPKPNIQIVMGGTLWSFKHFKVQMQRAHCGKCGEQFTNEKGVKQQMLRMHINKTKKVEEISNDR